MGFLSDPFGTDFSCFNWDKRKKWKKRLFQECFLWGSSSTDHRYKHNSVHLSFAGETRLKNTFCVKPGEASTHRHVCTESLFHTRRAPKTYLHLWLIPGSSSAVSSDTKCFNAELLLYSLLAVASSAILSLYELDHLKLSLLFLSLLVVLKKQSFTAADEHLHTHIYRLQSYLHK